MLTGPQRKFCEGVVSGLNYSEAYRAAYPKSTPECARKNAPRLKSNEVIAAEIDRLRARAAELSGGAVLTLAEKRSFVARLLRSRPALLDRDSDLWQSIKTTKDGVEYRLPDKLGAIDRDNDLAGEGNAGDSVNITIVMGGDAG